MTENEARFILSARRPDGADDRTPPFSEALAVAETHPALAQWHARERALDIQIAGALSQIQPPTELRDAILAGGRMSRATPWWRTWGALAACAAILIAGGSLLLLRNASGVSTNVLLAGAYADLDDPAHGPVEGSKLEALLSTPGVRLSAGLAGAFEDHLATGCRTVRVAGFPVIEVCFVRPEVKDGEFHLYIARAGDFPGTKSTARPHFTKRNGLDAVTWSDGRHVYVLVTDAGRAALREIF